MRLFLKHLLASNFSHQEDAPYMFFAKVAPPSTQPEVPSSFQKTEMTTLPNNAKRPVATRKAHKVLKSWVICCALLAWGVMGCVPPSSFVLLEDQKVAKPGKARITAIAGGGVVALDGKNPSPVGGAGARVRVGVAKDHEVGVEGFVHLPGASFGGKLAHKWQIGRYASWSNSLGLAVVIGDSATSFTPQFDTALILGTDHRGPVSFYGGLRIGTGVALSSEVFSGQSAPFWAAGAWVGLGLKFAVASWGDLYTELGGGLSLNFLPNNAGKIDLITAPIGLFSIGFDFKL